MTGTVVVVSFPPDTPAALRDEVRQRARAALRASGTGPVVEHGRDDACWLAVDVAAGAQEAAAVVLTRGSFTAEGALVTPTALTGNAAVTTARRTVGPFAALVPDGRAVLGVCDPYGLRGLYWYQGDGWAALGSSATALAAVARAELDPVAVGAFALLGSYLDDRTPFLGVRRLRGGEHAVLRAGGVDVVERDPEAPRGRPTSRQDLVAEGVAAARAGVAACLRAHPEASLELSGGLDSRLVLAAIPPPRRLGRAALTIDHQGSGDAGVAAVLAQRTGLRHEIVPAAALADLPPERALALCRSAAREQDHMGNPVAQAILDWVEAQLPQTPRLSGQNGEYLRGYYYAGQPPLQRTSPAAVRRLARWRLFANEQVDPGLFAPGFHDDAVAATMQALVARFEGFAGDWLQRTDEYYLHERMARWVGTNYTSAARRRPVLAPFFHPDWVEWGRRAPARAKHGSRLFSQVLRTLDPGLASVPLENGLTPGGMASRDLSTRLRRTGITVRKVRRKVEQRLRPSEKPAAGAPLLAAKALTALRASPEALTVLQRVPFLDGGALEMVAEGRRDLDSVSLAFLLAVLGAVEGSA